MIVTANPMSPAFRAGWVSVIVPTYNRAEMTIEALGSIIEQNYRPIEVLVIDDGSTDNTFKDVSSWGSAHSTSDFTVAVVSQENRGPAAARNRGLHACSGEYIQFLDCDDILLPGKISAQVKCLTASGFDFCYGKTRLAFFGGESKIFGSKKVAGHPWITKHFWVVNNPLYRRHVCLNIGPWNESLVGREDFEYSARVKAKGYTGVFLDALLDEYRLHSGPSVSRQNTLRFAEASEKAAILVNNTLDTSCPNNTIEYSQLSRFLVGIAYAYARSGENQSARRCLISAAELAPRVPLHPVRMIEFASRLFPPHWFLHWIIHFGHVYRIVISRTVGKLASGLGGHC